MKLTIEENREAMRRYAHIKRAPRWGSIQCSARCPGTVRTCTLKRGHAGLHVTHGMFGSVLAVWDKGTAVAVSRERLRSSTRTVPRRGRGRGDPAQAPKKPWDRLIPSPHTIEAAFLLILVLAMIGFAIDWALRILGAR
jgi:hypothetical protein